MNRTVAYLRFVDLDRMLHMFRATAGRPSTAEPLGGWEAPTVQLRGHSTGHLLSGLAQAAYWVDDAALAPKGAALVDLFTPSEVDFAGTTVRLSTGFPYDSTVRLSVAGPADFTLRVRIPGWVRDPSLRVNGRAWSRGPAASPRCGGTGGPETSSTCTCR
jgi:DUF1680 family protein